MDLLATPGVIFHGIAQTYYVTHGESISCNYTVDSSISPGVRDWVGIFPDGWHLTTQCLTYKFAPLPVEYQPDQAVDCSVSFDGDRLSSSVRQTTACRFCYISGTNAVLGMSSPFQLVPDLTSHSATSLSPSFEISTADDCDDDFVELEEDEDGEIVVIKSRTTYLEEELQRVNSTAKVREEEFQSDKALLLQQLQSARQELTKLTEDKQMLQQLMTDNEHANANRLSELQTRYDESQDELKTLRRENEEMRLEISSLRQQADATCHALGNQSVPDGVGASAASVPHVTSCETHSRDPSSAQGGTVSDDNGVVHVISKPCTIPLREPRLPDVVTCSPSSTSPSGASSIMTSPSSWQRVSKFGWREKFSGVGLNMFCHLKNAMDPFGVDQFGTDMDEMPEVDTSYGRPARFSYLERSLDNGSCSQSWHEQMPPAILRPPTTKNTARVQPSSSMVIFCPFCQMPMCPSPSYGGLTTRQQLLEHILREDCGTKGAL